MSDRTDFLYARPSFTEGVARLLDFASCLNTYNISATPAEADIRALRNDWYAVGDDLRSATEQFSREVAAAHERASPDDGAEQSG